MDWLTTMPTLALAVRLDVAVGLGHGADERGPVLPVHLHVRVAGSRIRVLLQLRLDGRAAEALAVPLHLLVHHGLGDADARDRLALGGVMGGAGRAAACSRTCRYTQLVAGGRVVDVAGDAALGVAREEELLVAGSALRGAPDVAARLAVALHGRQGDHDAGPLVAGGGTAGAAPAAETAGGQHGLLAAPLAGQRPDLARRDARLDLGPLGVFGTPSLLPST